MKSVLFLLLLLVPSLALAATAPPTATEILARAKAAMGGAAWNHIHSLRSEGTFKIGGASWSHSRLEDLLTGRAVSRGKLGAHHFARGFSGTTGWIESPEGVSSSHTPAAKMRDATSAYQTERAWWYPKRWPAKIVSLGAEKDNGKTFQVLRITPRGGDPFAMWINAKTHLIARLVNHSGTGTATTYLSEYRTIDGVKIPFHRKISKGNRTTVLQQKSVVLNVPVSAADFAVPKRHLSGFSFIGGGNEVTIPFKLIHNLVHIQVKINGHPLHFILDTGGVYMLTSRAAKAVGIQSQGTVKGRGAGKKLVNFGIAKVKNLTVGGKVTLSNQTFFIIPTRLPGFDGTIGYGFLKHFVTRINYANHELTLVRPGYFNPTNAGTPVPFTFAIWEGVVRIPAVQGTIDGLPGRFWIDTGNSGSLVLFSPFAKKHNLYTRYHATPEIVWGTGASGATRGRMARGGKLMIGSIAVNNPLIDLSTATKGTFASKGFAGDIGGKTLKRFTITFDYAHKRMYLKPNKNYGKPMNYDNHSGMRLKEKDHDFQVVGVMKGGPAAEAGIKAGDIITAVNGKPASKINSGVLSKMLSSEAPGTQVKLTIGEGKAAHTVTLTLRRLIPKTGGLGKKTPKHAL